jgi:hypothetical protein
MIFFFCDALQIRVNPGGNAAIVADVLMCPHTVCPQTNHSYVRVLVPL